MTVLGKALETNRAAQVAELVFVFLVAAAVVSIGWKFVETPLGRQAVVWIANVLMLLTVWIGLRVRGQTWDHFGLSLHWGGWHALGRAVLQSIMVLVLALAAFVGGSVVASNLATTPPSADMSGYDYLQGNLPVLLLALAAVYVVSSFGEEVLYRGFLINRIAELSRSGKTGWSIAVVASAVVFGLAHFDWGVVGVIQTAFMGLVLAVSYLVTKRNLWVLILAHAYVDTLLLVQMYLGAPAASTA